MDGGNGGRIVLLRFSGDISIKARATRHQFVRRLMHNLRDALSSSGVAPRVRLSHNRVFVSLPEGADVGPLTRVFGVQSISRVHARSAGDLAQLVEEGLEIFRPAVAGRRFAVRARRVGNRARIPISARELERELGAALLPHAAGVDLGQPEVTCAVELLEGEAYFLADRMQGWGGLPLGVEGRAVALFSGGFDSAVAAWQLLRRGVSIDYVFCNLGGETHRLGALRVAKLLADRWHYGEQPRLHAVDFAPVVAELRARTGRRYWQVLLKRQMLGVAERIAQECGAPAIATGESVGQVSSQTLQNLAVISQATSHMILRPLVGTNKEEIIRRAEEIGTFELSKVVKEYCDLAQGRPATAASLDAIEAEERRLDPALLERALAGRRVFELRRLDPSALDLPELACGEIPEGATVIDLRTRREYDAWHYDGALRLDLSHALQAFESFDRRRAYVLYCDFGLMSAHLAERMRKAGFEAFHFRGGTAALKRLSRGR